MMHLGPRPPFTFPQTYNQHRLVRTHGRFYAIPLACNPEALQIAGDFLSDPAVLEAATLDELREQIDACNGAPPDTSAPAWEGVRPGDGDADAVPVEYAGWLPVYKWTGNCGRHPQFRHTAEPPSGYRFSCSEFHAVRSLPSLPDRVAHAVVEATAWAARHAASLARPLFALFTPGPRVKAAVRWRVLGAAFRLFVALLLRGCRPFAVLRFLQTRHLQSQLLLGDGHRLVFLTSMPYTYGQNPWVIEIEDPITLFLPFIRNGVTSDLDVRKSPYLPIVKALLEAESCKAIVTHMRSTAALLPTLFDSEAIRRKVVYTPMGTQLPARWQRHEPRPDDEPVHLLFINSWSQWPGSFFLRGGLDVLEAFAILRERYPQLQLTLRSSMPPFAEHYNRILAGGGVRVVNCFLTPEEMADLHADSHIFLLPAARIHIVSLLQAMSYGLAVVGTDGWGMEEYLEHERNGLVVKGRYGKVSWADEEAGLLREDYEPMYTPDPDVVQGIVDAVSRLVEDKELRARLGRCARADVETRYNMEQWNQGLKVAFDRVCHPSTPTVEQPEPSPVPSRDEGLLVR
jgi:glycosyltransferase involved in cell wall biosynthesis